MLRLMVLGLIAALLAGCNTTGTTVAHRKSPPSQSHAAMLLGVGY